MIEFFVQLLLACALILPIFCKKKDKKHGTMAGKTAENKAKKGKGKKKSSEVKKKKEKKEEKKEESKEGKHEKKEEETPEKKEEKTKPEEPPIKTDKTLATEENKEEEKKEEGQGEGQKGDEKPTTPPPPGDEKKEGDENKDEKEGKEDKKEEGTGGKEGAGEEKLPKFSTMQCEWDEKGGKQTITVTNTSDVKMGMKIKTSDNNLFRVEPVFANIEAGNSLDVAVIRSGGTVKEDRVLILLTENKGDEDLEKLFKKPDVKITTTTIRQIPKGAAKAASEKGKAGDAEKGKEKEGKEDKKEGGTSVQEAKVEDKLPKFSMTQCEWDEKGGKQIITVTNPSEDKIGMKVKTTDNNLFRVEPVFANIEAGKSLDVAIFRGAGAVKEDKVLILLTQNKANEDLEKLFKKPDVKITTTTIPQTAKGAAKGASEQEKK